MKFLYRNTPRRSEEDLSAASSVQSVDSYEIFGSACSDYSDCEYCEERRRRRAGQNSRFTPSSSNSYHSAMGRTETTSEAAPLLKNTSTNVYRSLSGSSNTLGPGVLSSEDIIATYHRMHKKKKPEKKKNSSLVTIFSLWNTTMGSSLLTMAWGVERAGLLPALALLVFMGGLCLYTAHLLIKVNKHHGGETCEVPALCRTLLGRGAQFVAHGFSVLVLLGANIVYWILTTNFLYFTVNYIMDLNTTNTSNSSLYCSEHDAAAFLPPAGWAPPPPPSPPYWGLHSTVPVLVALIMFPLLNFKNASFFTRFTSLGTLSVMYLLVFVAVKCWVWGVHWSPADALVPPYAPGDAAVLSGMLALSFYIHNIIITIMNNNAKQENNGRDLTLAFVLVTMTYGLVGALFYLCFPLLKSCIEDNILNNFEKHDVMTAVARMLLLFQVVTVYPLVAFMLRTEALILLPISERHRDRQWLVVAINVVIVLICILFACFCPNIGNIIRYTGAVSGLVHVFALPALLQMRSLHLRGKLTFWKTALCSGIVLFGSLNLLMQFFI